MNEEEERNRRVATLLGWTKPKVEGFEWRDHKKNLYRSTPNFCQSAEDAELVIKRLEEDGFFIEMSGPFPAGDRYRVDLTAVNIGDSRHALAGAEFLWTALCIAFIIVEEAKA